MVSLGNMFNDFIKKSWKEFEELKRILEYIATRNELHNAVCIPKAKEALTLLDTLISSVREETLKEVIGMATDLYNKNQGMNPLPTIGGEAVRTFLSALEDLKKKI